MKSTAIIFGVLLTINIFGQTSDWETIQIKNVGSIKLPPSMEVQSGTYKQMVDEIKKLYMVSGDRIVFQQKGLGENPTMETYARMIFRTDIFNTGDFPSISQLEYSPSLLNELDEMYKQEIVSICQKTKSTFESWNKLRITELNGRKCLYFSYSRKMGSNPKTFSEFYIFVLGTKRHTLNFEYWLRDKSKWESELAKCKSSFKLNK